MIWRRSFGTFNVTSPALVCRPPLVVASPRIAMRLGALVALRVAQSISLGI
jgi:hypothetical protein